MTPNNRNIILSRMDTKDQHEAHVIMLVSHSPDQGTRVITLKDRFDRLSDEQFDDLTTAIGMIGLRMIPIGDTLKVEIKPKGVEDGA